MRYENREEVARKIEWEGLESFIMDYASADDMPDEELKQAFQEAEDALNKFESLLPEVEEC